MAKQVKYCQICKQFHADGMCEGSPVGVVRYQRKSPQELDTMRKIFEDKFDDKCLNIKETKKAYVFKFTNRRPYVVPKEKN